MKGELQIKKTIAASIIAMTLVPSAQALLQRTGPLDPANGYPAWYQDANGMALEMCSPTALADLNAGLCAITPGLPPDAGLTDLPEVFPTNFFSEHFYYLMNAKMTMAGRDKLTGLPTAGAASMSFVNAVEAAFASAAPEAGQQITFNRWRMQMATGTTACAGEYGFYTPHRVAKKVFYGAGEKIFDTEDIGVGPNLEGAMAGSVGPYSLRADTPGGLPLPFFTGADGKKYLSPGDLGPITGSAVQNEFKGSTLAYVPPQIKLMNFTNYVMVTGPGIQTANCAVTEAIFALNDIGVIGRVNANAIASRTTIDRATYRVLDSNADGVPDRFQVGVWAESRQEVGRLAPVISLSLNKGDPASTVAGTFTAELAMLRNAQLPGLPVPGVTATPLFNFFNGVVQPTVPGKVGPAFSHARVRTTTDTPPSIQNVPLVDELRITSANYNASTKVLTVTADSGALLVKATPLTQSAASADCSDPCLRLDTFSLPANDAAGAAIDYKMKVAAGLKFSVATATIPNVLVPPPFVTVNSSAGGTARIQTLYLGAAAGTAQFQNDVASTGMNTPVSIDVLANDIGVAALSNLKICTALSGGTCAVPSPAAVCSVGVASTTCTAQGGRIALIGDLVVYSPRANLGGTADTFFYSASTTLGTTLRALVTVNIGTINGLPDARDDLGLSSVAGIASDIDVLANDFAPGGVNVATLRMTADPCNLSTGVCAPGSATFPPGLGKLRFTAPNAGTWNMAYTFTDNAGTVADQGVVAVNVVGAESLLIQLARWTLPRAPNLGSLRVNGTSNIAQNQTLNLYVPNAATGPAGCNAPTLGTRIGGTTVIAGGTWDFGAIALAIRPATVYVHSPTLGGCSQLTVQ